jgi:hypothetical protein
MLNFGGGAGRAEFAAVQVRTSQRKLSSCFISPMCNVGSQTPELCGLKGETLLPRNLV